MKKLLPALFLTAFFLSVNGQYTKLLDFQDFNGAQPSGSLLSDGTFLYGMTENSSFPGYGVIFKIKPDGTGYEKLLNFTGAANGKYPRGSLITDGVFLYGMTYNGGTSDMGVIFKIKPDGTGYTKLYDFSGPDGGFPTGSLIYDGTFLYGMTQFAGSNNIGLIFKIKTDGTGFTKLLEFAGTTNGSQPYGSLISDGTFLYGMTTRGGTNDLGLIFKIKPDGTGFAKLLDFAGTNGTGPKGSLISAGTYLYAMTTYGGTNTTDSLGVIFKIKPDGTGYTKLFDFDGAVKGWQPFGSLVSSGSYLYGMTRRGGIYNYGILFQIKTDGNNFSKLRDFSVDSNGMSPYGSLISDGTTLYGMTTFGGSYGLGVVFKYSLVTGINENNAEPAFSLYPNPVSEQLFINSTSAEIEQINIYNTTGSLAMAVSPLSLGEGQGVSNHQLSIINLPTGVYIAEIKTKETVVKKRWVKM